MKTPIKLPCWFPILLTLFSAPQLASAYYDPGVQRWINRDPLWDFGFEKVRGDGVSGVADSPNQYEFVGNAPITSTDPLGLEYGTGFAAYQQCTNDCEGIRVPCKIAGALISIFGGGTLGPPFGKGGGVIGAACGAIIGKPLDQVCDDAVSACKKACEKKTHYSPGNNRPRPRA
jgi:RHS repeat-associated protein